MEGSQTQTTTNTTKRSYHSLLSSAIESAYFYSSMTSKIVPTGGEMHQTGSNSNLISMSASDMMMEQIQATHSPDGREFDIKLLLYVIEDILHHATSPSFPGLGLAEPPPMAASNPLVSFGHLLMDSDNLIAIATLPQVDVLNDSTVLSGISDMVELLAQPINVTLIEISYKCSWGLDSHTLTLALFNILSSFSWDAKVVIALAAFSIYYGRFWLVLGSNALASSMVLLTQLTQLPDMIKRTDSLKPKFEAITNLIKVMLDVTKCIVDFKELPSQYVVLNPPEMVAATASISIAVYWTLRSIVACALQLKYFNGMRLEHMAKTEQNWDLSSLAQKLTNIHNHLQNQLDLCVQFSEEGDIERFERLMHLFKTTHIDNQKILKALIYAKDNQLPLVDGSTKRQVSIDVLRRKNVLLLISNLTSPMKNISFLDKCKLGPDNIQRQRTRLSGSLLWTEQPHGMRGIEDGKYICLYGGENLDWIRRFTNMTRVVAEAAGIPLQMIHILPDPTLIWFFWVRLESMWHSKMQHGKTIENDPIMNKIMTNLIFDGSDKGWAVISRGKSEMAKAKGDTILKSLAQFDQWKDHIGEVGFVNALNDNLNKLLTPQHCDHLIFSCTAENIPETVVCATCKRHMEKFTMYRCCRD
ncbi:unnamed protein product [Camellia sinensis]